MGYSLLEWRADHAALLLWFIRDGCAVRSNLVHLTYIPSRFGAIVLSSKFKLAPLADLACVQQQCEPEMKPLHSSSRAIRSGELQVLVARLRMVGRIAGRYAPPRDISRWFIFRRGCLRVFRVSERTAAVPRLSNSLLSTGQP